MTSKLNWKRPVLHLVWFGALSLMYIIWFGNPVWHHIQAETFGLVSHQWFGALSLMQNEKVIFPFSWKYVKFGDPHQQSYIYASLPAQLFGVKTNTNFLFLWEGWIMYHVSWQGCTKNSIFFEILVLPNNDTSILTFQKTNLIKIKQISKYGVWL